MAGLMYKNFLLYRIELIVIAVVQLFVSATALLISLTGSDPVGALLLYGCMFLLTGFFESGLFAPDEKQSARSFLICAPTGAAGHIRSKYFFVLLINLGVLLCCFLTHSVIFGRYGEEYAMTGKVLVLLCSFSLINEALTLPFIVYFGTNYGLNAKGSAIGVLLLLALLYGLFGDISYFLSNDFMTALEKLLADENIRLLRLLAPWVALLLYWLSCKLSVVLFRRTAEEG
ncbi:MAG: ABC-2 transporter permease [Oscillospiraceae bacterium]|nr:ABC-2 transporter permease [Oscillospiraceae bacterium]